MTQQFLASPMAVAPWTPLGYLVARGVRRMPGRRVH